MPYLNDLIPYCTLGALLLAAIYHTSLYYFRKENVLRDYAVYLWSTFIAILITVIIFTKLEATIDPTKNFYTDFIIWISFVFYIKFVASALNLAKENTPFFWNAIRLGYVLIAIYLFIATLTHFFIIPVFHKFNTFFIDVVNLYCLFVNGYFLVAFFIKNNSKFGKFILAGAFCMIAFSLLSMMVDHSKFFVSKVFEITSFSLLCLGFFTEVVCFSIAMGYRLREDLQHKIVANEKVIQLQQLLLANELERKNDLAVTRRSERMIVSKDMHDELSNALAVLKFKAADLKKTAATEKENNSLGILEKEIATVYDSARAFMHKLFDGFGEQNFDLPDFLNTLSKQFSKSSLRIHIAVNNDHIYSMLNARQQNSLYFVIKESISNIIKYAEASEVNICIEFKKDDCVLLINDNGKGFSTQYKRGIGLQSIRERVEAIEGKLTISSSDLSGTSVSAIFPLQKNVATNIGA